MSDLCKIEFFDIYIAEGKYYRFINIGRGVF